MPAIPFSEPYKIQCRAIWYERGCPSARMCDKIKLFPPDENGISPTVAVVLHWMNRESWMQWKDAQDAALAQRVETELLTHKM